MSDPRIPKPKPCPFCGAEPRHGKVDNWGIHFIQCDCRVGPSVKGQSPAALVRAWNRRPTGKPVVSGPPTRDVNG